MTGQMVCFTNSPVNYNQHSCYSTSRGGRNLRVVEMNTFQNSTTISDNFGVTTNSRKILPVNHILVCIQHLKYSIFDLTWPMVPTNDLNMLLSTKKYVREDHRKRCPFVK